METQHNIVTAELTQGQIIDGCLNRLRLEIHGLLSNESKSRQIINDLATESSAFKKAYSSSERDRHVLEERFEKLKQETEQDRHEIENKLRGSRVVCLIDGDGSIFSNELIADGQAGGHLAAKLLSEATAQYLSSNCSINHFQLWVYVFFNKRGLLETFGRAGLHIPRAKFDDFVMGFNQAAERFLMVDVGSGKEAADAKIKVHLDDNICLPQTLKILFGGCHDNGYVTTLRSLITAGFRHKLILLRGYAEMAAGIEELSLPSMTVPDLFRLHKITTASLPPIEYGPFQGMSLGSPPQFSSIHTNCSVPAPTVPPGSGKIIDPHRIAKAANMMPRRPSLHSSYSSVLQAAPMTENRTSTPELDSGDSSTSSDISDVLPTIDSRSSSPLTRMKHVNSNIPLSKHKPPPCTLFYLSTCKHGVDCKYAHDYILEAEHYDEMRLNAKKAPCPSLNKGDICSWGDECFYGHVCPLKSKCHFLKQGRCKFTGAEMHRDT